MVETQEQHKCDNIFPELCAAPNTHIVVSVDREEKVHAHNIDTGEMVYEPINRNDEW